MTRWTPPTPPSSPRTVLITPQMADVLSGVVLGHTNGEIAHRLHVAEDTVKSRLSRLYRLLGARDRAHAAMLTCGGHVVLVIHHYRTEEAA